MEHEILHSDKLPGDADAAYPKTHLNSKVLNLRGEEEEKGEGG